MDLPRNDSVPSVVPAADASGLTDRPTFLIIDDDPVQRMTMGKVGAKAGYAVTAVATVEEALRELTDHSFDCITLDLLLGGQNGMVMLSEVARLSGNALLIIVSGASAAVREATLSIAADLRLNSVELPKPVDLGALRMLLTSRAKEAASS